MKRIKVCILALLVLLTLWGCGNKEKNSVTVEKSEACVLQITLEGKDAEKSSVVVVPCVNTKEDGYRELQALETVFDGVDTWYVATESGGDFIIQVITPEGREIYALAKLGDDRICSFHFNLEAKEETQKRQLWPETPHNNYEPGT